MQDADQIGADADVRGGQCQPEGREGGPTAGDGRGELEQSDRPSTYLAKTAPVETHANTWGDGQLACDSRATRLQLALSNIQSLATG